MQEGNILINLFLWRIKSQNQFLLYHQNNKNLRKIISKWIFQISFVIRLIDSINKAKNKRKKNKKDFKKLEKNWQKDFLHYLLRISQISKMCQINKTRKIRNKWKKIQKSFHWLMTKDYQIKMKKMIMNSKWI